MKIKSIGYIGLASPHPEKWFDYCTQIIGLMPARALPGEGWEEHTGTEGLKGIADDGSVYLKMDERQWRIAIHPADSETELLYFGLELDGHLELETAISELEAAGFAVRKGCATEAYNRAVTRIAYVKDPSGNNLELFYGPTTDYNFSSPVPDLRFIAGHLGVGHFNLFVNDQAECFDFYTRLLGFKLSDYIRYGPDKVLQFLRCNPRHHSLAFVDLDSGNVLQHMLVEMASIDDVGKTLDRARKAGIEIASTLGRHRNDGMLSFYMRSPGGFDVEIGCDGKLLDENWSSNEFCEGDVWGHDGLVEAVMEAGEKARIRAKQAGSEES